MKNLFLSTAMLLSVVCFGQKPDVAVGKATYQYIHIRDTTNRDKPYKETMALLLGRNASVYRSVTKQQQEEEMANQVARQVKSAPDPNHLALTITGPGPVSTDEYYQYINNKKLYVEEQVINYYLTEEPLPTIKWAIKPDTMSFGTLHAQKATTRFKGRDYTAWFCTELPFHNGPWKLSGLPGLIVEAYDAKKEVVFKFMGFEDVSKLNQTILPPADDIKTTPQDLARLKEARVKDPAGFSKAAHGGGQQRRNTNSFMSSIDPSKIASINIVKSTSDNNRINNNPIELPEKK
ncbi:GLPGLI family protein [Mucilaginibacter sp. 14171R-50]|uniref:GLPGLI family protein n=1 Tax=Mucilaginibacter sp. 14171R-50 TaxID=2703789 RepID=UPI00138BD799|nr:GLPGLI family protein [Mucilaginibacter sp. 14171R-50]QHS56252.1 GLPGLI family protein [Mucilaginibacter sp. 14171R-50]